MKRLWIILAIVVTFGFTVLGWVGSRIYQEMPPIPERIVTSDGQVVASEGTIRSGQAVWQTLGGMEVGSIWGHGRYVAPDWTADWLHRECEQILDDWARSEHAMPYADLGAGAAGCVARTPAADVAGQPLRPGHRNADPRARPRSRLRSESQALRGGVQPGQARIRDPAWDGQRSGTAAAALRLLLLDRLGVSRLSPRRRHLVREQLASRAADRQRPDR
jgi:hypothetical protein